MTLGRLEGVWLGRRSLHRGTWTSPSQRSKGWDPRVWGRWRDPRAVMDEGPAEMLPEGRAK